MVKLIANNEQEDGFYTEVNIDGDSIVVIQQLVAIFDGIYEASPILFESALLLSQYIEDHT